ncbi:MAG: hypothetical protein LBS03_04950 [Bacteroidales bacterium]|jgi:uncharacterized membrane protein|nr:hypothetical protein [Bacteroidales bacterium]
MKNNELWAEETRKIFNGILLFSLAWILYGIVSPIESALSLGDTLSSFAGGSSLTGGAGTFFSVLSYLLLAGIIVGYVLVLKGLGSFRNLLEPADSKSIGNVRTAFILALVAAALDIIPFIPGIIGDILYLIAVILMLIGYSQLKASKTFDGADGASLLLVAMIILIVGWVLDFIPFVGDWIEAICTIVGYALTLIGWNKIKNA